MNIELHLGDITSTTADVIVNPANSQLTMMGGVAVALKNAGGQIIEDEAVAQAPCAIGQAVFTTAGALPIQGIIHAPTMEHRGEPIPPKQVELATIAALRLADDKGFASIAFPALGTGAGDVSYTDAARIMVETIQMYMVDNNLHDAHIYLPHQELYDAFKAHIL